uniref:uncharacterized protein LOC120348558 isoform X1 n=1 Tax=Styela clava TaxID=7725 RepID=UPI00193A5ACE|nr:uncharacterized protein LOC120348558 isoform X1 [Styela clava]
MQPEYDITTTIRGKMFISPIINFTSENKMLFQKNVMVSIHTTYTAADSDKKIPVQVIWRRDSQTPFKNHIQKLDHGNERFITFECKHFCGYSIVADETQFQNMQRHYYSAAYVRQPRNQETRFLHWLIFEDCPHAKADNRQYLCERDTVIDPEGFAIRYNYNLQLRMNCESVQIHANNQRPNLVEKWGSRFTESYQFKIMKCQEVDDSPIEYEIMAMHCQNHATYQVIQKHFYMEWLYEALAPNVVVNAHDSSTGLSINNPTCGRDFHHQISRASSGYESVSRSPSVPALSIHEEFSHSSVENEQPPVQQEDADDIMVTDYDVDDASIATVPKSEATISEDDGGFASLSNESQSFSLSPLAQSTPNSTRVETIAKEDRDSMMCDEKGFSNS